MQFTIILLGLFILIVGLVTAFYGAKVYKFLLPLSGALVGFLMAYGIANHYSESQVVMIIAGVIGAILVGAMSGFLWKLGVVLQFFFIGFGIVIVAMSSLGLTSQDEPTVLAFVLGLVLASLMAMFAYMTGIWNYFLAIGTAVNGAIISVYSLGVIFFGNAFITASEMGDPFEEIIPAWLRIPMILAVVGLALAGIYYQIENDSETKKQIKHIREKFHHN